MRQSIKVIQVFKKLACIEKPNYTPELRSSFWQWPEHIESTRGHLQDETLMLPNGSAVESATTVTLIDSLRSDGILYSSPSPMVKKQFEIFRIQEDVENQLSIHTHFSSLRLTEVPQSANHGIGLLAPGQGLRYSYTDRLDFSLSARKQRTFVLHDYIILYCGLTKHIEYRDPEQLVTRKLIDPESCKWVDERRVLK